MVTELLILGTYGLILVILSIYGFHRSHLVWLYFRHRRRQPKPAGRFERLPRVTVQLPLFNERNVAERLLEAVARIDYPRDRLDIQVLDDSTDETTALCRRQVGQLARQGFDIQHLHRSDRTGYKAGALAHGLASAKGEFVLIFDADFIPPTDILEKTIHYFTDPQVGLVQARWGHLNWDHSALTGVQALMLDGHFVMEQTARYRTGRFFCFNGTAGIWRRATIDDAGGWEHDTLTEDMDLSYRAQLKGWRFIYLKDLTVPAELPEDMNAFKAQQFRWAKGALQGARKLLPRVLRAPIPWPQKLESYFHFTDNISYLLLWALTLLLLPCLLLRTTHGWREVVLVDLPLFFGTTFSVCTFYITTQREEGTRSVAWALKHLPLLLATGIGLCINQTRAVLEALIGRESAFVRTPKAGASDPRRPVSPGQPSGLTRRYQSAVTAVCVIELAMAAYFGLTLVLALRAGRYASLPFVVLFGVGYGYVGLTSLLHGHAGRQERRAWRTANPALADANSRDNTSPGHPTRSNALE